MRRKVTGEQLEGLRVAVRTLAGDPAAVLPRTQLAAAARTVCALLEARYPGGTVELRVPPFAAVQLGIGDRGAHTRGTPPNVVQTDAVTLLRLAGGSLSWAEARTGHGLLASGIYADLAGLWPLPELG